MLAVRRPANTPLAQQAAVAVVCPCWQLGGEIITPSPQLLMLGSNFEVNQTSQRPPPQFQPFTTLGALGAHCRPLDRLAARLMAILLCAVVRDL